MRFVSTAPCMNILIPVPTRHSEESEAEFSKSFSQRPGKETSRGQRYRPIFQSPLVMGINPFL